MWIRSQDRKKLTEIHDVTIYHDKQMWAGCSFIGEYSTEEKALKVLDQIQYNFEDILEKYHFEDGEIIENE